MPRLQYPRPPPVQIPDEVEDDAFVHSDLLSEDVRRVHPELGLAPNSPRERMAHLDACDDRAYAAICHAYPELRPPSHASKAGRRPPPCAKPRETSVRSRRPATEGEQKKAT